MEQRRESAFAVFEDVRARKREEKQAARRAVLHAEIRRRHRRQFFRRILAFGIPLGLVGAFFVANPPNFTELFVSPEQPIGGAAGRARIIDGDTIIVHGTTIRLDGIDAPEAGQTCEAEGRTYDCGRAAEAYLNSLIGLRIVTCDTGAQDPYGRTLAHCSLDGMNVNEAMVRAGWALAYRQYLGRYTAAEDEARAAGVGLWRGRFDNPADWRHARE